MALRLYFKKRNVPGEKEYDPKCAPDITKFVLVNNLIEKEEKPEVTINSKNDVKEGKSVDTNIPAIEHFSDDKIQRHQVLDDGKHGDDLKEPDHYYVPKHYYVPNTGEADH